MTASRLAILLISVASATIATAQIAPPPYRPDPMVWQAGINQGSGWKALGCPHDYADDDEKNRMIRNGECKNVETDGTPKAQARPARPAPKKQR